MNSILEEVTGQKQTVTVRRWFDRHLHLREGPMLKTVLPSTLRQQATGAVIMGNLPIPTSSIKIASVYLKEILMTREHFCSQQEPGFIGHGFNPRMTCYLTDEITPEEVVGGFQQGVWCGVKMYLAGKEGGTTNSHHGVKNLKGRYSVFEAMEKHNIPLLGHFEAVEEDVDEFDREAVSCERHLVPIVRNFPSLPIVVEHVTDGRMADYVAGFHGKVYATVTAHHLMINRNEMFSGGMNPGHYCKPVPKRESHRLRIRKHVTLGDPRFGAGTDSAPHDEEAKSRCYGCAAGIFTAPHAVELYTTVFDEDNALEHLGPFLSENFVHIYGMKKSDEMMTIERKSRQIPQKIGNVQVFMGGQTLPWTLVS